MKILREDRAARLFPVLAWAPDEKLFFLDDQTLGFGFICQPLTSAGDAVRDRVNVFLNLDWPKDTIVSFALWTSPDVEEQVAQMESLRVDQRNPLLRRTVSNKARFLRDGTVDPIDNSNAMRVRDNMVVITVKIPFTGATPGEQALAKATEMQITAYQTLETVGMRPEILDNNRYVRVLNTMLNWGHRAAWRDLIVPECDDHKLIREQLLDFDRAIEVRKEGLVIGDKHVRVLSAKRFPDRTYFGSAINMLVDMMSGTRGIRENVLITLNVRYPDQEAMRGKLQTKYTWLVNNATSPVARFVPNIGGKKQDFDVLYEALNDGDRPVQAYMSAVLFCDSEKEAKTAAANARTFWRELGYQFLEDKFVILSLFLNALPLGADHASVRDLMRYRTMATRQVLPLLPILGDWKGTGTPALNFISRSGQLMHVSLYDSATNYNAVIAAQSGSGKSFLANEIITSYLSMGAKIWVIDVGRSYAKLCEILGGQFIEFTQESSFSLNPFHDVISWEEDADVLSGLITAMAAPTQPLTDYQTANLKRTLKEQWDLHGSDLTITQLAQAFAQEEDQRVRDLGGQLYPFTEEGEYGRFFHRGEQVRFQGNLTVLELEELKGRKHLQQVVLLQLIYQIQQATYLGDRSVPKIVIIDEAWDLLTQGDVSKFIETAYRRFRKYNASCITITQSVMDMVNTQGGQAILNNSANRYLLGQKSDAIDMLQADNRLPLTEGGYELLKTVHTVPGHYSEIFFLTDAGGGIGRLIVEPFNRLLYSTRPQDEVAIRQLVAQGMSLEDAIEQLVQKGDGKDVEDAA